MFPIMRRKRPTIASALSALALSVALASLAPMSEERPEAEDGTLRLAFERRQGAVAEAVRRLDDAGVVVEDVAESATSADG